MILSTALVEAARDYRYLLDRGYPTDATLKLAGDRHRLTRDERMVLYRGVLGSAASASNRSRLTADYVAGGELCVDGYNVLFTLMNYLRGASLFLCTDGLLRDSGGVHGHVPDGDAFGKAVGLLVDGLARPGMGAALVALDAPVSSSGRHAAMLREAARAAGLEVVVELARSADPVLKARATGVVATSDSAVVAAAAVPVFDLARCVLEGRFGAAFPDLDEALRLLPS